jgi:hypothetical protein
MNALMVVSLIIFGIACPLWAVDIFFKYVIRKKDVLVPPLLIITIGIALSSVFAFIPYYTLEYECWYDSILASVQNTIRLFTVDDGIKDILEKLKDVGELKLNLNPLLSKYYITHLLHLFILAPITTFTAILSIFVKIWYHIKKVGLCAQSV